MAISTYAELQTAVGNWLNRGDLTSYIPDLIMLGERKIYRDLRIRAMETALSGTIASGVIAVPSDYIELKSAYINSSPTLQLQRRNVEFIYDKYPVRASEGRPKFIAREGSNFIFGPYPDSGYTVQGIYYKRLTALSVSNTTNWFTDNAPDLLLYASLVEAEAFVKNDARIPLWVAGYERVKAMIEKEDKREAFSGSAGGAAVSWR